MSQSPFENIAHLQANADGTTEWHNNPAYLEPRITIRDCADYHLVMYALTCLRIDAETSSDTAFAAKNLMETMQTSDTVHTHLSCSKNVPECLYQDIDRLISTITAYKIMIMMSDALEDIDRLADTIISRKDTNDSPGSSGD